MNLKERIRAKQDEVDELVTYARWSARAAWAESNYEQMKHWSDRANRLYRAWLRLGIKASEVSQ